MKPIVAASRIAAVAVVVLSAAGLARAADEAKFYPPEGWTVGKDVNGTAVQPPGVPAGKSCALLIMPDLERELDLAHVTVWKVLTEGAKVVSGGERRSSESVAGFQTRSTTAVVEAPGTSPRHMYFFSVQAGPRVRMALYVSDDRALFDKHLPAVKTMLNEVGVDPAKAKQMREATKGTPTGFEGVFYRAAVEFNPAGGRGELGRRVDFLCLAPDGRAYTGHVTGGPAAVFEAEDLRSSNWGRYTLRGDDIAIKWHFDRTLNQQHTQKLKRRADGKLEQDGGGVFHRLDPCDGLKLDGTYARTWGDGSKTRIRFTPEGRFTEQGLNTCVMDDDLVNPDLPKLPERGGAGTYSIARNTLEVKYDNNGPSRRMLFATTDDPADPKRISRISVANNPLEREP